MKKEFDGKIYVSYSKACQKQVMKCLKKHYSLEEVPLVFDKIHQTYWNYLDLYHRDLGGKKNSHNGVGGTYDCFFLFCVHEICKDKVSLMELEEIEKAMTVAPFSLLSFVNLNKNGYKRLFHFVLEKKASNSGGKHQDYRCVIDPYDKNLPLHYYFTTCPVAEFALRFHFEDVLPYLCNADYYSIAYMKAKLVRVTTLGNGDICDFVICGDKDLYLKDHEEYRDTQGYIKNR